MTYLTPPPPLLDPFFSPPRGPPRPPRLFPSASNGAPDSPCLFRRLLRSSRFSRGPSAAGLRVVSNTRLPSNLLLRFSLSVKLER